MRVLFITTSDFFWRFFCEKASLFALLDKGLHTFIHLANSALSRVPAPADLNSKIRGHRIALTNILPSSLLCPPEGVFNFSQISESLVYFIRWYILPSCDGHFQSLKTSLVSL